MGTRIVALSAAAFLLACTDTPSEPEGDTATSSIVARQLADTAAVYPDRLEFPKSVFPAAMRARISAGREKVILVGDRASNAVDPVARALVKSGNPYGYLRHALSVRDEGDTTVVTTEPASLEDAFSDFHGDDRFQMRAAAATGLSPFASRTFDFTIPVVDVSNQELYAQDGLRLVLSHGFISVDTAIDVGVDLHAFSLDAAHVILQPTVTSGLELEVDVTAPLQKSFSTDIFQGRWPVGSIGPIPVTLGLVASVGCDVRTTGTARATTAVGLDVSVRGGVDYRKNVGTKPVWSQPDVEPHASTPAVDVSGALETKCFIRPKLEILLFDAAGPTLTPELSTTVHASQPPLAAELDGGFALDLGGELRIFGKEIAGFETRLFSVEKPLWKTPAP